MFWVLFVGIALMAAAVSIVLMQVRPLATLLVAMFFLFVVWIYVPGLLPELRSRNGVAGSL
jgi:hypothetical protein